MASLCMDGTYTKSAFLEGSSASIRSGIWQSATTTARNTFDRLYGAERRLPGQDRPKIWSICIPVDALESPP